MIMMIDEIHNEIMTFGEIQLKMIILDHTAPLKHNSFVT